MIERSIGHPRAERKKSTVKRKIYLIDDLEERGPELTENILEADEVWIVSTNSIDRYNSILEFCKNNNLCVKYRSLDMASESTKQRVAHYNTDCRQRGDDEARDKHTELSHDLDL